MKIITITKKIAKNMYAMSRKIKSKIKSPHKNYGYNST